MASKLLVREGPRLPYRKLAAVRVAIELKVVLANLLGSHKCGELTLDSVGTLRTDESPLGPYLFLRFSRQEQGVGRALVRGASHRVRLLAQVYPQFSTHRAIPLAPQSVSNLLFALYCDEAL